MSITWITSGERKKANLEAAKKVGLKIDIISVDEIVSRFILRGKQGQGNLSVEDANKFFDLSERKWDQILTRQAKASLSRWFW